MRALGLAVLCKRSFLILAIMGAAAGRLPAQTENAVPQEPPAESAVSAPQSSSASPGVPEASPPAAISALSTGSEPAAPGDASDLTPAAGWSDLVLTLFRTLGGVGLVLCLILGGFVLFRKYAPAGRPGADRNLRLIESLPLGDKRNIVLLQVGNRKLLLASTPGQVNLLTSFTEMSGNTGRIAAVTQKPPAPAAAPGNFKKMFELQKQSVSAPQAVRATLPPDIRGKMLELRKALEG
jgi:flagellar biosynthetic protein FliO